MGKLLVGAQYEVGEHANKRAVIPHRVGSRHGWSGSLDARSVRALDRQTVQQAMKAYDRVAF
jgi:hypothetical protein